MKFGTLVLAALLVGGCLGGYNRPMQLIYYVGPKYPPTAVSPPVPPTPLVASLPVPVPVLVSPPASQPPAMAM